ncbi:helix-turn-helix domain-containing protein [Pseudomonas frederiksbergensis]
MDDIGSRLKSERTRLGFSQTDFGAIGGVQKLAQINYEKGERFPGADYLQAIAKEGADVQFIVTGDARNAVACHQQDKLTETSEGALSAERPENIAMSSIASRLKFERKRLTRTQAEMAKLCGISREIWCRYEQGSGLPGSEVLQEFLKAGGNVHFVLSGEFPSQETLLIERFKACPKILQDAILRALQTEH